MPQIDLEPTNLDVNIDLDKIVGKKLLGKIESDGHQYLMFEGGEMLYYFTAWEGGHGMIRLDEVKQYLDRKPFAGPDLTRKTYQNILNFYNANK
tara:strand:- start:50047 stop:50328 length:282 start_codon:yes stop_codon:yes gene_type:complete